MVKGITRQVIVMKTSDTKLFEQAIFLLKEDALERQGVTEHQILEEAKRIAEGGLPRRATRTSRLHRLPPLAWSSIGAALTGFVWLLSLL